MSVLTKSREKKDLSNNESETGIDVFRREIEDAFGRAFRLFNRSPWFMDFDRELKTQWPALDVTEDGKTLSVRCDLPGLRAQDINVDVTENNLTISGKRDESRETTEDGAKRRERFAGSFFRSIPLPSYAQIDAVKAKYENGVLNVTVPIKPGEGQKRVAIETAR